MTSIICLLPQVAHGYDSSKQSTSCSRHILSVQSNYSLVSTHGLGLGLGSRSLNSPWSLPLTGIGAVSVHQHQQEEHDCTCLETSGDNKNTLQGTVAKY